MTLVRDPLSRQIKIDVINWKVDDTKINFNDKIINEVLGNLNNIERVIEPDKRLDTKWQCNEAADEIPSAAISLTLTQ